MRLREFFVKLNEDTGGDVNPGDDGSSTGPDTKKSSSHRGKVHDHHASAIKGMQTITDWPGM